MDKAEFINKMIGVPWVTRAASFGGCDCWGLVVLYYLHVKNIKLPSVDGYDDFKCNSDCWINEAKKSHWLQVESPTDSGLVFTCYESGAPKHVGITIGNGKVLHSNGHKNSGGVQINTIRALESLYGKMTYHKFTG